ncbi:hypothetical protein H0H81_011556 [Sphagnurus paluster]|uniref:Tubulin-folding cofactor D C-terminal domain-containing protein n=1 Tax=Sphagnurus paluster TaxID=117069 RepID=A0A9P7K3W7_9AGAR|nr:hypothetical protein H0H81_011556 [Sphagnurus paluster]
MAYRDSGDAGSREVHMREIFWALSRISFDVVVGSRNAIVTAAACRLISITLTLPEIQSDPSPVPHWRKIIDHGLKHRTTSVQEAAADAVASFSRHLLFCISTLIRELSSSPPIIQQSLGTVLGAVDYSAHTNALPEATQCLLEFVKPSHKSPPKQNVEARRNCYAAFSRILSTVIGNVTQYLTAEVVNSFYDSLLNGLNDYSMDERGDVGSWIRVSCVQGLTAFSEMLIQNANSIPALETYLPPSKLHAAISGILKQGVERLDNVRQESGECIRRLLALPLPVIDGYSPWSYPGSQLLNELFNWWVLHSTEVKFKINVVTSGETPGWNEAPWLFPRALRLLEISEYRSSVLTGFVLTIGCKTDSTQRPLATSLVSYAKSLPLSDQSAKYDVNTLIEDLISQAKSQIMSNAIVIPILQTFNVLLEADALSRLSEDSRGLRSLEQLITLFTRNISRLKSVPRIHETMKLVVHLLPFQPLFEKCVLRLVDFLGHDFPRTDEDWQVRSNSAEFLYVFLQGTDIGRDTDEVEEMLLETEWLVISALSWQRES